MKTLEVVVKKRNELKNDLELHLMYQRELLSGRRFIELVGEERNEFGRLAQIISKLKVQIDSLTYVINYDSVMEDVTKAPPLRFREDD